MFRLLLLLPSSPSPKKPGGGPRNVHAPCAPRCRSQRAQSSPLAGLPASDIFPLPPRGPSSSGTPELFRRSSFLEPASSCHGASAGPEWGCCEAAAARGLTGLGICPQVIASLIPPRRTCPSPATRHPKPRGPIHRHVGPQLNPHKPLPSTRSGGGRGGPRGLEEGWSEDGSAPCVHWRRPSTERPRGGARGESRRTPPGSPESARGRCLGKDPQAMLRLSRSVSLLCSVVEHPSRGGFGRFAEKWKIRKIRL